MGLSMLGVNTINGSNGSERSFKRYETFIGHIGHEEKRLIEKVKGHNWDIGDIPKKK
jgi:hypothetical protein